MIPILIGVTLLVFFVGSAAGNPIALILHGLRRPSPQLIAYLRSYYGLDKPPVERYLLYLWNLLHFNLGKSTTSGAPVASQVGGWAWTTLYLQLSALFLSLAIGIPVGIYSAKHQYTRSDYAITSVTIFGYSMPTFWLGLMLIFLFGFYFPILPSFGASAGGLKLWWGSPFADQIAHLILPMCVLAYVEVATWVRLLRGNMLEVMRQDYILAAYASGLSDRTVTYKHALKNAISPIITSVGLTIGGSLGGAPALETAFTWPGLGYAFTQAALALDIPTVEGITVIITIMVLAANLIVDLVYGIIDPRVRVS
jgi:ABC-type dipeptide/oligopeptide/nickel transport system permease component